MQGKKPETAKPAEAPKAGAWKTIAFAIVALAVLAVAGVVLLWPEALKLPGKSSSSLSADGLPEASDFTPQIDASAIYAALEENGVQGALVEIGAGKTMVSLTVPAGADGRKTAFLAIGAAGALSPASHTVTVEAFEGAGKKTYSTGAANVHALLGKTISEEEFEKRVSES